MKERSFILKESNNNDFLIIEDDKLEIRYTQDDSIFFDDIKNEIKFDLYCDSDFLEASFTNSNRIIEIQFHDYIQEEESEFKIFTLIINGDIRLDLKADPAFMQYFLDKLNRYLYDMYEDAERSEPIKIVKPLTDLLKEAISHDNIVYNINYFCLNLNTNNYNEIKQKTLLNKENLIAVLNQQPPLQVNDPLTRQEIKTITKIKFVEPIPIKSNLISTSNRKRSRSIGGGKKSKQTRKK